MLNGAVPSFDIEGGWLLALARGLTDVGLISAFGTLIFRIFVLPRALAGAPANGITVIDRPLLMLVRASLGLASVAALAWLVLTAGAIAGTSGLAPSLSPTPAILSGTFFGHLVAAQIALLLAAGLTLGGGGRLFRWWLATGLSAVATGLQAGHGHAMAMYHGPSLLLLSQVLHLLTAGAWLGGLLPLALAVRVLPPQPGALAARWFSPLGQLCVAGLVLSAGFQFWVMIGGLAGLVGTAYGWIALVKVLLLLVLLGLAATNRYRLTPASLGTGAPAASRALLGSIAWETGIGLLVVLAAGVLSSLPPAMHIQPVWPFREQLSLAAIQEDPGFRQEVIEAAAALAVACVLLAAGAFARRIMRWIAFLGAAILAWFAVPHLDLLLVEAYPTSFYHSTTGFSANAIATGAELYPQHCAGCHGADGRGDGPNSKGLPMPPADLTAGHLWAHGDGELFWWLSHGIEAAEGGLAMPGFSGTLSDDERWDLIDYIRAHNAGLVLSSTGSWSPPAQAPDLPVTCPDQNIAALANLRGRIVRVIFATGAEVAPRIRPSSEVATVLVTGGATSASAEVCTSSDPDAWRAYGIVSATEASDMAGTQFLVDGGGFLRLIQRPAGMIPRPWRAPSEQYPRTRFRPRPARNTTITRRPDKRSSRRENVFPVELSDSDLVQKLGRHRIGKGVKIIDLQHERPWAAHDVLAVIVRQPAWRLGMRNKAEIGVQVDDGEPIDHEPLGDRLVARGRDIATRVVGAVAGDIDHFAPGRQAGGLEASRAEIDRGADRGSARERARRGADLIRHDGAALAVADYGPVHDHLLLVVTRPLDECDADRTDSARPDRTQHTRVGQCRCEPLALEAKLIVIDAARHIGDEGKLKIDLLSSRRGSDADQEHQDCADDSGDGFRHEFRPTTLSVHLSDIAHSGGRTTAAGLGYEPDRRTISTVPPVETHVTRGKFDFIVAP